jgi:hypothetical protein
MSNGVTGVASDTINAFRGFPILLVMVLLNAAFLFAGVYYLTKQQDDASQTIDKVLQRCLPDVHMEAYIVTSPPRRGSPAVDLFNGHQ